MNFRHILAALALSLPGIAAAVPADPRPRQLTNPDGSVVTVRMHGDEYFHFMSDEACTRILQRDARGYVCDMIRDGAPVAFTKENVRMLSDEALASFPVQIIPNTPAGMQRMGTLDLGGRSNYPTKGEGNRSLVVLVEFKDVDFTVPDPKDYYTRQLNEPGFSEYGAVGSALDYYKASSNGLYAPQFDVYGPVKISRSTNEFKEIDSPAMAVLIEESLKQLHESGEVNFSDYDLDEDGIVDTVFFYYAGYGSADSETETIWPHQYDYRYLGEDFGRRLLSLDGKRIGPYACANELKGFNPTTGKNPWKDGSEPWVNGIGTFVHEYGHVLGLPDLYDVEDTPGIMTPDKWSVMDFGSYNFNSTRPPLMSAYEQWVCRWLEYTDAVDATHYDLKALGHTETPTAVRIPIPTSADGSTVSPEYFLLEARDGSGWDLCFPESGLMVWRINYNRRSWLDNEVNSKYGLNVELIFADGIQRPLFSDGAIYKGADAELIPSKDYPFWKAPYITGISYDNDAAVGSFDYNMAVPTDYFTVLHDSPVAAPDGSRAFKLTWDPVDGVDSYQLTVRVANTGKIIGDFDAKDVGSETSVWVTGLSSINWKYQLEAFVTCVVDGMTSTHTSNIISFKPSELELEGASVDAVEAAGAVIAGGSGCVIAPEDACVYDLAGQRLPKDRLAPGVYIVVYGPRTEKVLVR